jgi:hypothetical protein
VGEGISDAKKRREDLEREENSDRSGTETSSSLSGTLKLPVGVTTSYKEVPNATALRMRLTKLSGSTTALGNEKRKGVASHPLVDHPDSQI